MALWRHTPARRAVEERRRHRTCVPVPDMGPRSRLAAAAERFRIGELATQGGVSRDAIRFYEREGLLPRPRRTPSRHRIYDHRAIEQIRFIRRAQDLGLSLADIRQLLALREVSGPGACRQVVVVLAARLKAYEERIAAHETYRERLRDGLRRCRDTGSGPCPFMEDLQTDAVDLRRGATGARPAASDGDGS